MEKNTYCSCRGCRFPASHITSFHKCSNCKLFGHSLFDCDDEEAKNELTKKYNNIYKKIPFQLQCTINKCKFSFTHTSESHEKEFEDPKFILLSKKKN